MFLRIPAKHHSAPAAAGREPTSRAMPLTKPDKSCKRPAAGDRALTESDEPILRSFLGQAAEGPFFDRSAERLARHLKLNHGWIPVKKLGEVHPTFTGMVPSLADVTGLLDAAGAVWDRDGGNIRLRGAAVPPVLPKPAKPRPAPVRATVRADVDAEPSLTESEKAAVLASLDGGKVLAASRLGLDYPDWGEGNLVNRLKSAGLFVEWAFGEMVVGMGPVSIADAAIAVMNETETFVMAMVGSPHWQFGLDPAAVLSPQASPLRVSATNAVKKLAHARYLRSTIDGEFLTSKGKAVYDMLPDSVRIRAALVVRNRNPDPVRRFQNPGMAEAATEIRRLLEIGVSDYRGAARAMLKACMGDLSPTARYGPQPSPQREAALAFAISRAERASVSWLEAATGLSTPEILDSILMMKACEAVRPDKRGRKSDPVFRPAASFAGKRRNPPPETAMLHACILAMGPFTLEAIGRTLGWGQGVTRRMATSEIGHMHRRGHLDEVDGEHRLTEAGFHWLMAACASVRTAADLTVQAAEETGRHAGETWRNRLRDDLLAPQFLAEGDRLPARDRGWTLPPRPGDRRLFAATAAISDIDDGASIADRILGEAAVAPIGIDDAVVSLPATAETVCRTMTALAAKGSLTDVSAGAHRRNRAWKAFCRRILAVVGKSGPIRLDNTAMTAQCDPEDAWLALCFLDARGDLGGRWTMVPCPERPRKRLSGASEAKGKILRLVSQSPRSPGQLTKETGFKRGRVGRLLHELQTEGFIFNIGKKRMHCWAASADAENERLAEWKARLDEILADGIPFVVAELARSLKAPIVDVKSHISERVYAGKAVSWAIFASGSPPLIAAGPETLSLLTHKSLIARNRMILRFSGKRELTRAVLRKDFSEGEVARFLADSTERGFLKRHGAGRSTAYSLTRAGKAMKKAALKLREGIADFGAEAKPKKRPRRMPSTE